jgi:hypothetical protein
MVKHVVLWRLADHAAGNTKAVNLRLMKNEIEGLMGVVPGLMHIEVGFDFNGSEQAWDIALYSELESPEALAAYQAHPEHVRVAGFVAEVTVERAVVDYEVPDGSERGDGRRLETERAGL